MHDTNNDKEQVSCRVRVQIKSFVIPYLSEFVFQINRSFTVAVLKNWISTVFKGYINELDQRLFFDGCEIEDSQYIGQFIRNDLNEVTFDLIMVSHCFSSSSKTIDSSMVSNGPADDSLNQDSFKLGKIEHNVLNEGNGFSFNHENYKKLPIYYQAAVINNEPCLLKVSNYSKVSVLNNVSFLSTGSHNSCEVLLMSSGNILQYPNQDVQNNSQSSRNIVNPSPLVQDPDMNNERLRMAFVHLWLFIRLAFFVGLFSVNSSWIRFCTLVFIALQFFFWHTGRLISIRLFFERIINRNRHRNSPRNERSSFDSESELSRSTSHDQNNDQHVEFNWRRNLGHKILTFIISLFPLTE